jgi:hypothetical protein
MNERLSRVTAALSSAVCLMVIACAARSAHAQASPPVLHVDVSAGAGLGDRALERPAMGGVLRIANGLFPAAHVGLRTRVWPEQRFSLEVLLGYQTTIFDRAYEHPPNAMPNELHLRSHHVELSALPLWRPQPAAAWALGLGIGYALRVFWPDVHNLQTPRQFLTGPFVRPELLIRPVRALRLRIGPELHWIATRDPQLRAALGDRQLVAVGGQVSASLTLSEAYLIELVFRESHVVLAPELSDMERYLTLVLTRVF